MRRLPSIFLLALTLALLALAPASASPPDSGTPVVIAVPMYVPVDGNIDMMVFTGAPGYTVTIETSVSPSGGPCEYFPSGTHEARTVAMRDTSSGLHSAVTGIMTSEPLKPGSRLLATNYGGYCELNGQTFYLYPGVTE